MTHRTKHRWRRLAAVTTAATVLATGLAIGTTTTATAAPPAGTYQITVARSGHCLDVVAGSMDNSAQLQQWSCSGDTWQQFALEPLSGDLYQLRNIHSNRCLDVPSSSTTVGTRIQQWSCKPAQTNQQWRLTPSRDGSYLVANAANGLCLSIQGASTASGAAVVQEGCTHNTNKQLRFTTTGSGSGWSSTADGFASTDGGTTGGAGGTAVTVTTQADLEKYVTASGRYVITVAAPITISPKGKELKVASDKTIIGRGTSGEIVGGGFFLGDTTSNVILRNLTIRDTRMTEDDPDDKEFDYDAIQMDGADHVWIDHNRLTRMNDGLIDSRKDTTNLTVSWNVLEENNKAFGIGWTDNVTAKITIHHNWVRDTNQRNPSTDNVAYAHLYNNYLQDVAGYGNYARGGTKMVLQNSWFERVKDPFYRDGTAALAQSGSIVVSSSGRQESGGTAFDPRSFYPYTLDAAADVPSIVRAGAGPQASIG
ncbi:RICIN domain-containing protein [Isoptericola dokdonensis]|uniref:Pectate trisaccharide-lyase n=1 Tax=Isoptericola dokdonensis DS-3 TaxID=1300344 RepID=A0A168FFU0_9MICO|nr:RICIN domain-containing protein [Isoptericola dokdonensis]ANC31631.1 Pectate trisaccharide-lyase precursor [Isoptericola dokdonensis DS-3]